MAYHRNEAKLQQAEKLLPILLETEAGELLSYERIGDVLGHTFGTGDTRDILRIARELAIEQGKHFMTMRRDGIRAFRPSDYERASEKKVKTIHTAARKGYKIIDSISNDEFKTLSSPQQLRHSIRQSQLELLEKTSAKARFERITARNHNQPPDTFNMRNVRDEFASLENRKPKRKS